MICKKCGHFVEDDKRFCTNCGEALNNTSSAGTQTSGDVSQNTSSAPHPQFKPLTTLTPVSTPIRTKNGISKEKTIMFWASKAAMILALVLFFLPFMKI